jgi:hypothetical protein
MLLLILAALAGTGRSGEKIPVTTKSQDARVLCNIALAYQGAGNSEDARRYAAMAAKFDGLPGLRYAFVRMKAEKLLASLQG